MQYWGKVVGGIAGLATGRPFIALVGLLLGHQFDRGFADRLARFGPELANERLRDLPADFVRTLFQVMGRVAKSDGRVSEEEIRAARAIMHRLGLGPVETRHAIAAFEEGKAPAFALVGTLRKFRAASARQPESRALFVRLLMEVALAKQGIHQAERATIWAVCKELEISRVELAQLEAMLRAQRGFRRSAAGNADSRKLDDAYGTLGVTRAASNAEIKQAYRRLMNRNHPDKISSSNPDPAVIAEAEKRTREVRSAYEMLKARRSIR